MKTTNTLVQGIVCGLLAAGLAEPTKALPPYNPIIDPADFTSRIDNPFYPLKPGTTYTYNGMTEEGVELNTVVVTKDTKIIVGVTCVVVLDTVYINGELEELTYDWYAQDKEGNVWYFGEDASQFADGELVGHEGSWEAGVDGAQPGVVMEGEPGVGDAFRQEYLPGVAEDMSKVISLKGKAAVPYGTFSNCVVTKDFSSLEKQVVENKWFARGVGLVKSVTVKGGLDTAELVSIEIE